MKVNIRKYSKNSHQRVDVNIEPFDTWSLDYTLALIILPAMIQLKETKHGIPNEFSIVGGEDYDNQHSFDFYTETYQWAFDEKIKQWDEVLDKIIWSFTELVNSSYDELYHHGTYKFNFVKSKISYKNPVTNKMEKTYEIIDENPNEHWYDHVGHMMHEQRIQEGLNLFGRYFRAFWD